MKSEGLTDADIRALGWQALVAKLGVAGALRFTMQTERGYGDYSEWRHRMFGKLSVEEILAQRQATPFRRAAHRRRTRP